MDFHGILMKGPIQLEIWDGVSLPSSNTEARMIYWTSDKNVYFNNGTKWVVLFHEDSIIDADTLSGHDSTYFSESDHTHNYANVDHTHSDYLQKANNLNDLSNHITALENLGITISDSAPTVGDGENGDVWLQYV